MHLYRLTSAMIRMLLLHCKCTDPDRSNRENASFKEFLHDNLVHRNHLTSVLSECYYYTANVLILTESQNMIRRKAR